MDHKNASKSKWKFDGKDFMKLRRWINNATSGTVTWGWLAKGEGILIFKYFCFHWCSWKWYLHDTNTTVFGAKANPSSSLKGRTIYWLQRKCMRARITVPTIWRFRKKLCFFKMKMKLIVLSLDPENVFLSFTFLFKKIIFFEVFSRKVLIQSSTFTVAHFNPQLFLSSLSRTSPAF